MILATFIVGDKIVFDAYKKGKPEYVYQVVAYKSSLVESNKHNDDANNLASIKSNDKNNIIPTRCTKDVLDKTAEKSIIDDVNRNDDSNVVDGIEVDLVDSVNDNCHENEGLNRNNHGMNVLDEMEPQEEMDQLKESDYNLDTTLDNEEAPMSSKLKHSDEIETTDENHNTDSDVYIDRSDNFMSVDQNEARLCMDSDDDTLNLSQDSFLGTPFESTEPKVTIKKPTDMPSMIANLLWRALNSSQPQNGFGFLMHMGNALNTIPNNIMTRNFSKFLQTGPMCEGTAFKDFKRTELTAIYLEQMSRKMADANCHSKFNLAPAAWSDLEEIFSLPLSQTKGIDTKAPSRHDVLILEQALQMSSTSLKLIALNLELELLSIMKDGSQTDKRRSYSNLPFASLVLNNRPRQSLKIVVHLATQCWVRHSHWLIGNHNQRLQINDLSGAERCSIESKACFDAFGAIICYLSWLYCMEEKIDFGHDDCCFVIKDAMLSELSNLDYSMHLQGKKATHVTKKKILTSIKLRFVLAMETSFSRDVQLRLGSMLGVSSELNLLDI